MIGCRCLAGCPTPHHRSCCSLTYGMLCRALGITSNASVNKAINPEADAAAPIVTIATDSPLGPAGTRALASAILSKGQGFKAPGYKHIKNLRLWRADAQDSGCAAVAEVLKNGSKEGVGIEMVELMDSSIGVAGARAMGSALMLGANTSLQTLRLDMNQDIGDDGLTALCKGLRTNRNLKVLTLSYCNIGPIGAAALADVIASPLAVLEAVDLTGNKLMSVGLELIALAAKKSKTLKELILVDNSIGSTYVLPPLYAAIASDGITAALAGASVSVLSLGSAAAASPHSPGAADADNDDVMDVAAMAQSVSSPIITTTSGLGIRAPAGPSSASATTTPAVASRSSTTPGPASPHPQASSSLPVSLSSIVAAAGASDKIRNVAMALAEAAEVTKRALHALGECLMTPAVALEAGGPACALCRVSLEMNALTAADADVLIGYVTPINKKVEMFKVRAKLMSV